MHAILKRLIHELKHHIPFTIAGALSGIVVMAIILYGNWLPEASAISESVFYILHPTHVFLSALVTTTLYVRYGTKNIWLVLLIGYTGSIGIATISDSIIPYLGELLLDLPNSGPHIGFIEKPIITNIPAFVGIALGYAKGFTKIPHAGHVLISTWASLFHIIMALGVVVSSFQVIGIFVFLFLAVWLPCCTSDIAYPLLFQQKNTQPETTKNDHAKHH